MLLKVETITGGLGVLFPSEAIDSMGLRPGSEVDVTTAKSEVASSEPSLRGRKSLDDLLALITKENLHAPLDWGTPSGKERFWSEM